MKSEKELFEKAEKIYHQYSESRYPKAIAAFRELLGNYPENIEGWTMMATMQSCINDFDGALASMDEAIKLEPNEAWIWDQKSLYYHQIAQLNYADSKFTDPETNTAVEINSFADETTFLKEYIDCCDKQLALMPEDHFKRGDILEKKGELYKKLKLFEPAINAYKEAIDFHRKFGEKSFINPVEFCYLMIGKIHEENDEYDLAISAFESAYDEEKSEILLTHLGRAYQENGDSINAQKCYDQFMTIVEEKFAINHESAYLLQMISALKAQNKIQEAIEKLKTLGAKATGGRRLPEILQQEMNELMAMSSKD